MSSIHNYIHSISNFGIIISLIFYDSKLEQSYWYFSLEIIRSFSMFLPKKISNLKNVLLVVYYFILFNYFLNETSKIYSMWNGYITVMYVVYSIYELFVYKKKSYNGTVIDNHHPLLRPYNRRKYPVVGRGKRNLSGKENIEINIRGVSSFTS